MPSRRLRPSRSLVEYGVIGDLHTAALVSRHGSIDWLCWPRLDAPSVFAALLDEERGGRFSVEPTGEYRSSQAYEPDTNVLHTTFATATGRAVLTDFMPVEEIDRDEYAFQELHRVLRVTEGRVAGDADFSPRFDYARRTARVEARGQGVLASSGEERLVLSSELPFRVDGEEGSASATWDLAPGESLRFVLRFGTTFVRPVSAHGTESKLRRTTEFWRAWVARGTYPEPWAPSVRRSALALKLLTYAPTGALAAAATTSLPETPGGTRNWDYRYSWVRDSAYAMQALLGLGHRREARRYLRWLRRLLRGLSSDVGELRVLYGLEGETELPEETLSHLRGYRDSTPVRIGNEAVLQAQHDIYGSMADAIFEAYALPEGYPDEAWRTVRALADHVVRVWERPDHGIWEIRGEPRRYTHSALMGWVTLDRALRLAEARGHPEYHERWGHARAQVRDALLTRGYSAERGAFVQVLGGSELDASLLLVPILGLLPAADPRVLSTLDAIDRELGPGPFLRRYRSDTLPEPEGAFLLCSFWMVHALALAGRADEARRRFEAINELAGPLGLLSEEADPATGQALGNFPQALTHLAHINAALALDRARGAPRAADEIPATS